MKCEWGCVKGNDFWVGSTGMPFYGKSGEILSVDPLWVKKISPEGGVTHVDWRENYAKLAKAIGIAAPGKIKHKINSSLTIVLSIGYVKHESGGWSEKLKRWVFLPRRACKEAFTTDERMGTNVLLLANENFDNIEVK